MNTNLKSVTVVINCVIRPDKMEMAIRELKAVTKTVIETEEACRGIRVHSDPDNPTRLLIVEYWDSKEIFLGAHMQTPHMVKFLKVAQSFLDGEAEFNFWNEIPL